MFFSFIIVLQVFLANCSDGFRTNSLSISSDSPDDPGFSDSNGRSPDSVPSIQPPEEEGKFLNASSVLEGSDPRSQDNRPDYLQTIPGSIQGTLMTRITPDEAFGQHQYSKRQAWNADETRVLVGTKILDAKTFQTIGSLRTTKEVVWSTTDPNIMYGMYNNDNKVLIQYNISTGEVTNIQTFTGYTKCTIGDFEGSQSDDNKYIVLACYNSNNQKDLFSVDIKAKAVLGQIRAQSNFNWASVSRSGKYILVENNQPGSDFEDRKIVRYDINFENEEQLTIGSNHGDFAYDENGDDVYVMVAWDYYYYLRLRDGVLTNLGFTNRAGDGHVSCRAYDRPGWCYFSSRDSHQRLGAFKIGSLNERETEAQQGVLRYRGISVVELWGFSKSSHSTYENQAKVSVSPSGKKMIFSSNWAKNLVRGGTQPPSNEESHDYILELTD